MAQELITWYDYEKFAGVNISAQIGDVCYYTPVVANAGYDTASKSDIVQIGRIKEIRLIDTEALDTTADNGLVKANEAYVDFTQDPYGAGEGSFQTYGCGHVESGMAGPCPEDPSIITLNKTYKEAGIIPGMAVNVGIADELTSTGTLNNYSTSIHANQTTGTYDDIIFVKSVNPNGDNEYQIEIGQYNLIEGEYRYSSNDEKAEVLPDSQTVNYGSGSKKALTIYKGLQRSSDMIPDYKLDHVFVERPTRLRFSFDNEPSSALGVMASSFYSHYPYSQHTNADGTVDGTLMTTDTPGSLSPFYGKTKFWMVVSEVEQIEVMKGNVPNVGDFQMFSKDNSVNLSSPIGYYAQVKIENNSKIKSEMFGLAVDAFESSK